MIDIQLKDVPLSTEECNQLVASAGAGGTVVFVGTVRDQTKGKKVIRIFGWQNTMNREIGLALNQLNILIIL